MSHTVLQILIEKGFAQLFFIGEESHFLAIDVMGGNT
jgi:hypothetical protein